MGDFTCQLTSNEEHKENYTSPAPSENIDVDDFIHSHGSYNKYTTFVKNVNVTTLAYVTPWNKKGYDIAEVFAMKFSMISPVWFQIMGIQKAYTVTGVPDIDKEWISRVRTMNPQVKFVPRIIFEDWTGEDFASTIRDQSKTTACIAKIVDILKRYNFDGAVIEIWSQFSGLPLKDLAEFVDEIADTLHLNEMIAVLAIPPPIYSLRGTDGRFLRYHFDLLYEYVDYFSLMTYDYTPPMEIGPNSPIEWVEKCVERIVPKNSPSWEAKRAKILTGLNFYGTQTVKFKTRDAILGHQFVETVKQYRPSFQWNAQWAEHKVSFVDDKEEENVIFYPSLLSIARRQDLIQHMGTGMSIWEIGQGLDSFYTLL